MSRFSRILRIEHPALEPSHGEPVLDARLDDPGRLAVVLQAAALLSHLYAAGWRLAVPWGHLRVDARGLLTGASVEPGAASKPPQRVLLELLTALFRARPSVAGRGRVRASARRLAGRWQCLSGWSSGDRIVAEVLGAAPLLWHPRFGAHRRYLISEYRTEEGERLLRVAGRGAFERRLLQVGQDRATLESLVGGRRAGWLWTGRRGRGRRQQLLRRGHWQLAAELSRRTAIGPLASRLEAARALHGAGAFEAASDRLAGLDATEAQILYADCRRRSARPAAARRVVEELSTRPLRSSQWLSLSQVAVAVYGDLGDHRRMSIWSERLLGEVQRAERPGALLLAAEAAYRLDDLPLTRRRLEALSRSGPLPELAWRTFHLRGRCAQRQGDPARAGSYFQKALGVSRRCLRSFEAAELWRSLASAHRELGQLKAADRAANHALLLLAGADEICWRPVARQRIEIRLRRGLLDELAEEDGVESLWSVDQARVALVRGRPKQALERLQSGSISREAASRESSRIAAELLSARALGWMGKASEALERLRRIPDRALRLLEPEERPAVWALAGELQRAAREVRPDAIGRVWRAVLAGEAIADRDWDALRSLESYRAARLVFDLALVAPDRVSDRWIRFAVTSLQQVGAESFARRLAYLGQEQWLALEDYLNGSDRGGERADLARLYGRAGFCDIRLSWTNAVRETILVPGEGGRHEVVREAHGGRLVLRAAALTPALRALFALTARDLRPPIMRRGRETRCEGILGDSKALRDALERLERLARSDVAVLIHGETGTGKELAARQVHRLSRRCSSAFLAVNCAALSESLLLSDLFGHVKGAFTGADRDRAGVFETAAGGTVFLDEIGDLPQSAQGKLLRVLQEGELRRVGESSPRRVDVRIVAATHRDLERMVEQGRFRRDLFYRLKVGCVSLPPLRERGRDVLVLADQFIAQAGHRLSSRARERLTRYSWPGNVRELKNVLQVAVALTDRETVDESQLELPEPATETHLGYHQRVRDFRRQLVKEALSASGGNRARAARQLDLSRQALAYLARKLEIV